MHVIHRQSTCFIRADNVSRSHCFARSKSSDEIVLMEHLLNRECQRKCNCKRQSFRDSHHNNRNSNNQKSKNLRKMHSRIPSTRNDRWEQQSNSKKHKYEKCSIEAKQPYFVSQCFQFLFQRCLIIFIIIMNHLVEFSHPIFLTNNENNHFTLTTHNFRPTYDDRRCILFPDSFMKWTALDCIFILFMCFPSHWTLIKD